MKIKGETRVDDGERQELAVDIVAETEEVDKFVDRFFKKAAEREIEGFRKGRAPRAVLERSVGGHEAAMNAVAEMIVRELAPKAIDDAGIVFLAEPSFEMDGTAEVGRPFGFSATGLVSPDMKLADYGPVSIEMPPKKASEAEMEEQMRELQEHYHSFESIDDSEHVAEMGDYVEIILTVKNGERVVSGLGKTKRMIGLGQGTMPDSFDEHIVGARIGDTLEFDFEAKDDENGSAFGDGELHAVVVVEGFRKRTVPEIDDALAARVGCADVKDLRSQLEYTVNAQKDKDYPGLMAKRAIEALVARLEGEIPTYYINFVRQDVGRELIQSLEKAGKSLQQWLLENSIAGEKMKQDVAEEATRRAAVDCALEALIAHNDWEVTDEDIDDLFKEGNVEGTREEWETAYRMASIKNMCLRTKATKWLVETAEVTTVEEA